MSDCSTGRQQALPKLTLPEILALPELVAMRADIQRSCRRAAVEWEHTDAWFYASYGPGGDPPYPAGVEADEAQRLYRERVNALCRENGFPDYIRMVQASA